jgi:hypothetical protein
LSKSAGIELDVETGTSSMKAAISPSPLDVEAVIDISRPMTAGGLVEMEAVAVVNAAANPLLGSLVIAADTENIWLCGELWLLMVDIVVGDTSTHLKQVALPSKSQVMFPCASQPTVAIEQS